MGQSSSAKLGRPRGASGDMSFDADAAVARVLANREATMCVITDTEEQMNALCWRLVAELPHALVVSTSLDVQCRTGRPDDAVPLECPLLIIKLCDTAREQVSPATIAHWCGYAKVVINVGPKTRPLRTRRASSSPREADSPRFRQDADSPRMRQESPRPTVTTGQRQVTFSAVPASPKALRRQSGTALTTSPGRDDIDSALIKQ